jgi:bifunctional N-acetylglucosamine-1-phosphate-uridyltransferase/glucosamine-1-phosphate-acetyltransferase GlmU-like protein
MIGDMYSITMAAGASSRMPEEMRPKACCKVGAVSVIENALNTYEQAGIMKHVIVVGRGAEKVMAELAGKDHDVLYAFQSQARGTGDAARCGLNLLAGIGAPEYVLISAGDKVIAPEVIRGLLESFKTGNGDLALVTGRCADNPSGGRIIERDGGAVAIIRRRWASWRRSPQSTFPSRTNWRSISRN